MTLDQYITGLLSKNECVIIPGFGGFIANYHAAEADEYKAMLYPPYRSVLFNPKLTSNDGLLCSGISEDRKISLNDALGWIDEGVSDWRARLKNESRVNIADIGFLFTEKGQILFEQNRDTNLLLSSFGFSPVCISTTELAADVPVVSKLAEKTETKEVIEFVIPKNGEEKKRNERKQRQSVKANESDVKKSDKDRIRSRRPRRITRIVVAAIFIPLAFYSYWIPVKTDALSTGTVQLSDFNPFLEPVTRQYQIRQDRFGPEQMEVPLTWDEIIAPLGEDVSIYSYEFAEDLFIPVRLDRAIVAGTNETPLPDSNGNIHVITGCFSVKRNAEKLIADLQSQGFNASELDQSGGLHRVSAGSFLTRETAKESQEQLKNKGFSSWLLKK